MVQLFKRSVMKEDLICGVAILLYLVLGNYIPYKNAGKELWIYNGLFRNKVLSIKKDKAIIMCETDAEYAVLIEDNQFIAVAKNMDYDYCCAFTLGNAEAYGDRMGISCSVCLLEDNEDKAREMLKEAIIELSKNSKIDCDGL